MDRSTMDRTANVSWTDILSGLHQSVRKAVLDAGREAIGTRNAKGDDVKRFDLVANDAALAVFREIQLPLVVDSEESEAAARGVRCYGCASRAISLVAEGATDAHVDVRA